MERPKKAPARLFRKEVYQTTEFTMEARAFRPGTVELIIQVTERYYPLFRRLKHGLIIGQLSADMPPGYEGPGLEFIYKVLSHKVCFIWLKIGGFSQAEIDDLEAVHDL